MEYQRPKTAEEAREILRRISKLPLAKRLIFIAAAVEESKKFDAPVVVKK